MTERKESQTKNIRAVVLSDAEKWRRYQARELLREAGFVRRADGTWHEPAGSGNEGSRS